MPETQQTNPAEVLGRGWILARDLIINPSRAGERIAKEPDILSASLAIYLIYLCVSVVFYSWKPADFPAASDAPLSLARATLPQGPVFWAKVQAWSPVLTAIWLYFLAWFVERLKTGRLAFRLFISALVWVAPTVALVLWASGQIHKAGLLAVWALAIAPTVPLARAKAPASWRPLAALLLSIVAVNLALCPLFAAAVVLRADRAYEALELAMLFWTLGLGTYVLGRLEELPAARAFAALLFSMIAQMAAVFSLFAGGVVSKEILKALMSI